MKIWSKKFIECRHCGTQKTKHKGRGLCRKCWWLEYTKTEKRKEGNRRRNKIYYERDKNKTEFKNRKRVHYRNFQLTSHKFKKYSERKNLQDKFFNFLFPKKKLERWKGGLEISIDDKKVKTPISPKRETESQMDRMMFEIEIFKKVYKKYVR